MLVILHYFVLSLHSDEDEFLDRTGTIAKKRQKRMAMDDDKEVKKTEVDTFETLQVKHSEMEKTIQSTEKQLKETIEAVQAEKKLQRDEQSTLGVSKRSVCIEFNLPRSRNGCTIFQRTS